MTKDKQPDDPIENGNGSLDLLYHDSNGGRRFHDIEDALERLADGQDRVIARLDQQDSRFDQFKREQEQYQKGQNEFRARVEETLGSDPKISEGKPIGLGMKGELAKIVQERTELARRADEQIQISKRRGWWAATITAIVAALLEMLHHVKIP